MELFACCKGNASRIKSGTAVKVAQALATDWRMERGLLLSFADDPGYQPKDDEVAFWRSALDPHGSNSRTRPWRYCDARSSLIATHQDASVFLNNEPLNWLDYATGLITHPKRSTE